MAKLKATGLDVFSYEMFALWTFREALEEPFQRPDEMTDHEAAIPAAATWITILGHEIYHWDKESPSGPLAGAPGRGGPLWSGKHGFCSERYGICGEVDLGSLPMKRTCPGLQAFAAQAYSDMSEIER